MTKGRNRLFGDKAFYLMVLSIALPIAIQNGITNFVNLLDNVMVGRIGTEEMSGVSIANQLIFVFNLCIFGTVSGAGIIGAQFFGKKDEEGVRTTTRFKIASGALIIILFTSLFLVSGESLISLFLTGDNDGGDKAKTLYHAMSYLRIMILGLPGFALTQAYSSTLREGGETVLPMKAGLAAIFTNLIFNWILIFGNLGAPKLGSNGAAIATVISRYVEFLLIAGVSFKKREEYPYLKGLWKTFRMEHKLLLRILKAASPLIMNETLWSLGMTALMQCYSTRGLNAVAGCNIFSTISNLFNVAFLAVGNAIGIIVGQLLGAGKCDEAVETDRKLIAFSVMVGIGSGIVLALLSPIFPQLYNTTERARAIAGEMIIAHAFCLPLFAFKNASYFTLRSGGKIWVTILFDSAFLWCVGVPLAFLVSRLTTVGVVWIYLTVQAGDILKCTLGYILVKKRIWVRNITE